MAAYTCMLPPVVADDETYALELVYDTQEHLYLRDSKHLYIWATVGDYEGGDIEFFNALREYFARGQSSLSRPVIVQMRACSSSRDYLLLRSTFSTPVQIEFEYAPSDGKLASKGKQRHVMLFHRFEHGAMDVLQGV
jgi:hypothetical protein